MQAVSVQLLYILLCSIPALWTGYSLYQDLGANPVETMLHQSGDWGLHFLLLTLTVTPLRTLSRIKIHWIRLRRTLGLAAFCYALTHFLIFIAFELDFRFEDIVTEIVERNYILVGFVALCILVPLAVTSTTGWQRRLKRLWMRIHKGVYVATALVVLHYFMLVKADYFYPILYGFIFVVLMLMRVRKKTWRTLRHTFFAPKEPAKPKT